MAKRARGTVRPGQRRAQRGGRPASGAPRPATPTAPTAAPASVPSDGLTPDEEARAAALEAAIVAQEQVAPSQAGPNQVRRRRGNPGPNQLSTGTNGASLAARYAHEYDYVTRDLKRIFALMGILTGLLLAIWVVVVIVLKA